MVVGYNVGGALPYALILLVNTGSSFSIDSVLCINREDKTRSDEYGVIYFLLTAHQIIILKGL